jgi:nucleoside phosphorylase
MATPPLGEYVRRAIDQLAELFPPGDAAELDKLEAIRQRLQVHVFGGYETAVLNAIPREFAAVQVTFGPLRKIAVNGGRNSLDVCLIEKSNGHEREIVVAGVTGQGLSQTAAAAASVAHHLPFLRSIILVGIAAGQPDLSSEERDVWLGDIVISESVVQYDHVKREDAGRMTCRGTKLTSPSPELLACARNLIAEMEIPGRNPWSWEKEIVTASQDAPRLARPEPATDPNMALRTYSIPGVHRVARDRPRVQIGTIASANTLLKDERYRDALAKEHRALAYEMEGAGLAISAPIFDAQYLIVRGICDYADMRKNDEWQPYAALAAASFAKSVLINL